MMDYSIIIDKYYGDSKRAREILLGHSQAVLNKAMKIVDQCPELELDIVFIEEAIMVHDIGMIKTNAPEIGCFGNYPYICHGYLGREMVEKEGFTKHALVCERHTGTGLSKKEIVEKGLPLPKRDMLPLSNEEKLICLADKFFSKSGKDLYREKSISQIGKSISKYGEHKLKSLQELLVLFGF